MANKRKQENNEQTLRNRLDADLLDKLSAKKNALKQQAEEEQEQVRLRKIEERKQKEANKTFEELLKETEMDWRKYK